MASGSLSRTIVLRRGWAQEERRVRYSHRHASIDPEEEFQRQLQLQQRMDQVRSAEAARIRFRWVLHHLVALFTGAFLAAPDVVAPALPGLFALFGCYLAYDLHVGRSARQALVLLKAARLEAGLREF